MIGKFIILGKRIYRVSDLIDWKLPGQAGITLSNYQLTPISGEDKPILVDDVKVIGQGYSDLEEAKIAFAKKALMEGTTSW